MEEDNDYELKKIEMLKYLLMVMLSLLATKNSSSSKALQYRKGETLLPVLRHYEFQDFQKFFNKKWNNKNLYKAFRTSYVGETAIDTGGGLKRLLFRYGFSNIKSHFCNITVSSSSVTVCFIYKIP